MWKVLITDSTYSYDPDQDRWTLVQPMHSKRLGVGVVVINRLLYAIGGFDGNERLASVECYHPENNEWSYLPPLKTGRSGAGNLAFSTLYLPHTYSLIRWLCIVIQVLLPLISISMSWADSMAHGNWPLWSAMTQIMRHGTWLLQSRSPEVLSP